jgi:hypothetical protein
MAESALKNLLDPGSHRCKWTLSKPPDPSSWEVDGDIELLAPAATARQRLRQGASRLGGYRQWRPERGVASTLRLPDRIRGNSVGASMSFWWIVLPPLFRRLPDQV